MSVQLMLIPETREEILEREVSSLKKELGNVRRGIYAKHSELQKKYDETLHEFDQLKAAIAKGDKQCKSKSLNTIRSKSKEKIPLDLFTFSYAS